MTPLRECPLHVSVGCRLEDLKCAEQAGSRGARSSVLLVLLIGLMLAAPSHGGQWTDDAARCATEKVSLDLALHYCSRAIQSGRLSDTHVAVTFSNRGVAHAKNGDYDRAIQDYTQAIRLNPKDATVFNNRGIAYSTRHDYDHAIRDYDQAIRLGNTSALRNRAAAYFYKKEFDRSIEDYSQSINQDPIDDVAYWGRGLGYFNQGRFVAAARDLAAAAELKPEKATYALWLYLGASGGGENGPKKLARHAKRLTLTAWPGPLVALYLGQLTPEAVLQAASDPDPILNRGRACEAHFYLGEYYLLQGRHDQAREHFTTALGTGMTGYVEYVTARTELMHQR